jgi:hypothetical protein
MARATSTKLTVWDSRMILLMKHCIDTDQCTSQREFFENIGFVPSNLSEVRRGLRGFTPHQISAACKKYKISVAWIFGFSSDMKYQKSKSSIDTLKDAVRAVEADFRRN